MGLTIHFKLVAPPETDAARAEELVRKLRRQALHFQRRGRFDKVYPLRKDFANLRSADDWLFFPVRHHPTYQHEIHLLPLEGFILSVPNEWGRSLTGKTFCRRQPCQKLCFCDVN